MSKGYPVSELRRAPKEGDECVCGAFFEEGKPWKFGTREQCIEAEKATSGPVVNKVICNCGAEFPHIWALLEHRAEAHPVRYAITSIGRLRLLGRVS